MCPAKASFCTLPLSALMPLIVILLFSFVIVVESLIPDPRNHAISFEEEYEAFESELIASIPEVKVRTKRFIYMNVDTFVAVALLVGVPVSLVLPSLSNLFNKWRRRKRGLPGEDILPEFNVEDPQVQEELDRIATYFQLVDIPEPSCQLRAVCEFSANPDRYYPLSEMILSRIRNPSLPPMIYMENHQDHAKNDQSNNGNGTSLFRMYNDAADSGMIQGMSKCEKDFAGRCPYEMEKLLNLPTLRFWKAMQRFLQLRFTDGNISF